MIFEKIVFVVNPNADRGSVGKKWPKLEPLAKDIFGDIETVFTKGPGDGEFLTREAILKGTNRIVCIGGDGTLNEVVNGFMGKEGPLRTEATLGIVPSGTGCDFIKSVSIERDPVKALKIIKQGNARRVDIGRMKYLGRNGGNIERYFLNLASFGIGGEIAERVNQRRNIFSGFYAFIFATIISLFFYKKKKIHLKIDDAVDKDFIAWNISVANGRYQGGGMNVAPEADLDDGFLDITVMGDLSLAEVFVNLPRLYNGKILELDKVQQFKGKVITASCNERAAFEMDGEQPGELPVSIDIVPGVLKIFSP